MWTYYANMLLTVFPPVVIGAASYVWARGWMRAWNMALHWYGKDYDDGRVPLGAGLAIGAFLVLAWPLTHSAYAQRCEQLDASRRDEAWREDRRRARRTKLR